MKNAILVVVLLMWTVVAATASDVSANRIKCYPSGGGETWDHAIDLAYAHSGGLRYHIVNYYAESWTTQACLANVGPVAFTYKPVAGAEYLIQCEDLAGSNSYYSTASAAWLSNGVWTWVENVTGDVYISTMPCNVLGF